MTKVLVAYGSKMGGTREIAEQIAYAIHDGGLTVDVMAGDEVKSVDPYDAVVVGSALYAGRWRREAVSVLKKAADREPKPQVWMFHSGPLGELNADEPQVAPGKVEKLAEKLEVGEIVTFGGRLPDDPPGWIAKQMAKNEMSGDWRDLDHVTEWGKAIAADILDPTKVAELTYD